MRAEALAQERHALSDDVFVEIVVWLVPAPVKGSTHRFKYRLGTSSLTDSVSFGTITRPARETIVTWAKGRRRTRFRITRAS